MNEEIEVIKKYARSAITNKDGTITTARLNLSTGEIKPYKYNKHTEEQYSLNSALFNKTLQTATLEQIASNDDVLGYVPFWAIPTEASTNKEERKHYKPRVSKENVNNVYLSEYLTLDDALEELKCMDNFCTGVSLLDDGKNKPMNKSLLFNLLRDLDVINSVTIQEYTGYSERHCRKLAQYLRVLSNAFDSEIER